MSRRRMAAVFVQSSHCRVLPAATSMVPPADVAKEAPSAGALKKLPSAPVGGRHSRSTGGVWL